VGEHLRRPCQIERDIGLLLQLMEAVLTDGDHQTASIPGLDDILERRGLRACRVDGVDEHHSVEGDLHDGGFLWSSSL
jgi:hypothetical protein